MNIKRKEGLTEVKFEHNRSLFWTIIVLLAILIVMLIYIRINPSEKNQSGLVNASLTCVTDVDCVPASCCHPSSCTNNLNAPNCEGIRCSMECVDGSLDCGQGSCACVNNKCSVVLINNGGQRI
ncbi:MAG: hypothetical protein AABX17_03185 [Nanoarchaeota archaeon]